MYQRWSSNSGSHVIWLMNKYAACPLDSVVWFHLQIRQCNLPKDISSHLKGKAGKTACYTYHPWGTFPLFHQLLIMDTEDELDRLTAPQSARVNQRLSYRILYMYSISGMLHTIMNRPIEAPCMKYTRIHDCVLMGVTVSIMKPDIWNKLMRYEVKCYVSSVNTNFP
jgi:hypothetical protein